MDGDAFRDFFNIFPGIVFICFPLLFLLLLFALASAGSARAGDEAPKPA